ncbi:DUF2171 domain-containing protein [Sphingomonas sp.]|uniref:DUF2171 domain-containing protein n=1 Tax=Sphingomonas sp. TaxID=28214 RepID=UPI0031D8F941
MADTSNIREHMEVIGADGVHIGTVDRVEGAPDGSWRIKLIKADSGAEIEGAAEGGRHHHYIPAGLIAEVEGDQVRLSANADVAITFEEEESGEPI